MVYDVAVIGAGVVGSLTARALSRYQLSIALLDRANDVATGASKANSGIVHAGFDAKPGTLKASLNVRGAKMMPELSALLSVPFKQNGSLVLAFTPTDIETLNDLLGRGKANGVEGLQLLDRDALRELEPNNGPGAIGALHAKTAGIVCPYELTAAAAECAVDNGVDFLRGRDVLAITPGDDFFVLRTDHDEVCARYVINAAGVYSDKIAQMIGDDSIDIHPRLGEYALLDKSAGGIVSHTIFQCPTALGKGVLVSPTVDGNIIVGPTTIDVEDRDSVAISQHALKDVFQAAGKSVPGVGMRDVITSFGGLRAHDANSGDFVIGPSQRDQRFINVAGIESPGLASSPAIAELVVETFVSVHQGELNANPHYNPSRQEPARFRSLPDDQRCALIDEDPSYGHIVCRCETVTQGEIVDAIRGQAGARDLDGVKRRTRAGMGRCQSGFCGSKVMEILSRELDMPINEVTKCGGGSRILYERTK